jgi:hypothetical protein
LWVLEVFGGGDWLEEKAAKKEVLGRRSFFRVKYRGGYRNLQNNKISKRNPLKTTT